jgi:hypothetical protein
MDLKFSVAQHHFIIPTVRNLKSKIANLKFFTSCLKCYKKRLAFANP